MALDQLLTWILVGAWGRFETNAHYLPVEQRQLHNGDSFFGSPTFCLVRWHSLPCSFNGIQFIWSEFNRPYWPVYKGCPLLQVMITPGYLLALLGKVLSAFPLEPPAPALSAKSCRRSLRLRLAWLPPGVLYQYATANWGSCISSSNGCAFYCSSLKKKMMFVIVTRLSPRQTHHRIWQ